MRQPHRLIDHQFHTSRGRERLVEYLNRPGCLVAQRVGPAEIARDHGPRHAKVRTLGHLIRAFQSLDCQVEVALA